MIKSDIVLNEIQHASKVLSVILVTYAYNKIVLLTLDIENVVITQPVDALFGNNEWILFDSLVPFPLGVEAVCLQVSLLKAAISASRRPQL